MMERMGGAGGTVGPLDDLTTQKNIAQAIWSLVSQMQKGNVALPSGAVSGFSGVSSGLFLSIIGPDGNPYKIELFLPS